MIATKAAECSGRSGLSSVPVRPAPTVGWASAIIQTGRAASVLPVRRGLRGGGDYLALKNKGIAAFRRFLAVAVALHLLLKVLGILTNHEIPERLQAFLRAALL